MVDWRDDAACRTEDPELFFPIGPTNTRQIAEAKLVCNRCPVAGDCLGWAMGAGQPHGIWGGLSEEERNVLRRSGARITTRAHLILISTPEHFLMEVWHEPRSG